MAVEALRDRQRVRARRRDAQMQRAHAAQQQPRLERSQHRAAAAAHVADALPQLVVARGRERAGDHVGVAVQVLGRRVHDDLRAELERTRQHRRRRGRIDGDDGADLARDRARRGDVGDVPRRIRRRLDPDQARSARARLRGEVVDRCVVVELDAESPRRREFEQPLAQRPVHVARREHAVAGRERLEHRRRGRLARREQHRRRRALERRDQRLGLVVAGIVGARIDAPAGIRAVGAALVGRRRRGSAGRCRDRAPRRVPCPGRRAFRGADTGLSAVIVTPGRHPPHCNQRCGGACGWP